MKPKPAFGTLCTRNQQPRICSLLPEWFGVLTAVPGLVLDLVTNARRRMLNTKYAVRNGFIITPRRSLSSFSQQAAVLLVCKPSEIP